MAFRNPFKRKRPLAVISEPVDAPSDAADFVPEADKRPPRELPEELLWLLDAPLFIDALQVEAFYDAVVRPDYESTSITLGDSVSKNDTFGGSASVGVALPWFGKTALEAHGEKGRTAGHSNEVSLRPISNAYRHLIALGLHYAGQETPNRLFVSNPGQGSLDTKWLDDGFITATPRALVFLDLPPGSGLIPAALEIADGEVKVLAEGLGIDLGGKVEPAPRYPGSRGTEAEKDDYFAWFAEHYDDRAALHAVERAVVDRQVAWIDFNVSLNNGGPPFLHLHLVGHGQYDTGVFGYNFIVRGFNHGLRIVGTLKSGPDLNVLAIFER